MNTSNWINFLLLIVSFIAAAIAWRATFAARSAAKEANEIQRRLLAIEEERAAKEARAKLVAQLTCYTELKRPTKPESKNLVIQNRGQGRAKNLKLLVNDVAVNQHRSFTAINKQNFSVLEHDIGMGETIKITYLLGGWTQKVSHVVLTWTNEDGSKGTFQSSV